MDKNGFRNTVYHFLFKIIMDKQTNGYQLISKQTDVKAYLQFDIINLWISYHKNTLHLTFR